MAFAYFTRMCSRRANFAAAFALVALVAVVVPASASAELLFLSERGSMSIAGHRFEGDRIIVTLRSGGEMTFDRSLVVRIAEDEVPYPDPEELAAANDAAPANQALAQPPALVLMRDHFGVCLSLAIVLSTVLFGTFMMLVRGAMGSRVGQASGACAGPP